MTRPSAVRVTTRSSLVAMVCALAMTFTVAEGAAATDLVPPAPPTPVPYVSPYAIGGIDPSWTADLAGREQSYVTGVTAPGGDPTVYPAPADWYDNTNTIWGNPTNASFGPEPYVLPQPALPPGLTDAQTLEFYRQRIVQAAVDYIGTPYQHHHLPSWNPFVAHGAIPAFVANSQSPFPDPMPSGQWAWSPVSSNPLSQQQGPVQVNGTWTMTYPPQFTNSYAAAYGLGAGGIDCSDLTTLVYSLAAGFHMNSGVGTQGVVNASGAYSAGAPIGWNNTSTPQRISSSSPSSPAITPVTPQFLLGPNSVYDPATNQRGISTWNRPGSLDTLVSQLKAGDLLYISDSFDPGNKVTHVVIWLGIYGTLATPSGATLQVPLVISSHDNTPAVLDANAQLPPLYPSSEAGSMPPPGVHILPFAQTTWFYSNFSHAMRVLADGTGVATAGSALQFGPQAPGSASQPLTATVINTGTAPVSIPSAPAITGPDAGQFSVAPGDTCTGATLAPGSSCGVPVSFRPTVSGQQTASVVVPVATFSTSTPSPVSISLSGVGTQATTARQPQTITLTMAAAAPLSAGQVAVSATASSGLPVTVESSTPDVCVVSGQTARLLAAGVCAISASQPGNASFAAAPPVSRTLLVTSPGNVSEANPANPSSPTRLAPGLLLVSARTADETPERQMRTPPSTRRDRAPTVRVALAVPTALVVPGFAPGAAVEARIRLRGRSVVLGRVPVTPTGHARLPVFRLDRRGGFTVALIDTDTRERRFITVRVGGPPVRGSALSD